MPTGDRRKLIDVNGARADLPSPRSRFGRAQLEWLADEASGSDARSATIHYPQWREEPAGRFGVARHQQGMAAVVSVDSLTDDLFSLEEPWRSRFLTLVASRATWRTEEIQPTPEDVAAWLANKPALHKWTSVLLRMWERPRKGSSSGLKRAFPRQYGWDGT